MSYPEHPTNPYRLPPESANGPTPVHYDLGIKTDLTALIFSGFVSIDIHIPVSVQQIVLHVGKELKIFEDSIALARTDRKTESILRDGRSSYEEEKELLTVWFGGKEREHGLALEEGTVKLAMAFEAGIRETMSGYYRSPYGSGENKENKFYAVTQFEPVHARAAFPCFDEPNFKATFSITMISRAGTTSLSNMPVKTTKPCPTGLFDGSDVLPAKAFDSFSKPEGENQWEIIEFEETPKMSTYLVAYANGNF
ncbi:leukotriene A4 hydrolase N-terminal domain-containing protein, partial [Atractiella rhizophila]